MRRSQSRETKGDGSKSEHSRAALMGFTLTPDEVALPKMPLAPMQQTKLRAVTTQQDRVDYEKMKREMAKLDALSAPCTLDGFKLLEVCGVEFPEHGYTVDASNCNAVKVVEEDLMFFKNLWFVDCGRNSLSMEPFTALPALQELRLPCNAIKDIGNLSQDTFTTLSVLDLSYNSLTKECFASLGSLPVLQHLDVTCNNLSTLPEAGAMKGFKALQVLVLERNQIADAAQITALSTLPSLRELYLGYNYLTGFPQEASEAKCFGSLGTLSLAFNYIASEELLMPVVHLHKLEMLMLYGNPLLGPSGEDPAGDTIVELAERCFDVRNGFSTRSLEILTEVPRKRSEKRGKTNSSMYRSGYRGMELTEIDNEHLPTAAEFRAAGQKRLMAQSKRASAPKKYTTWNLDQKKGLDDDQGDAGNPQGTFVTGVDVEAVDGEYVGEEEAAANALKELVPESLFRRPVEQPVKNDPAKLRNAMSGLRFALAHPLTLHAEEPLEARRRGQREPVASRSTATTRARQLPRREFQPKFLESQRDQTFAEVMAQRQNAENEMTELEDRLDALNDVGLDSR